MFHLNSSPVYLNSVKLYRLDVYKTTYSTKYNGGERERALTLVASMRHLLTGVLKSYLKVLSHGHVFEVWILTSSGSDITIQIRTRGFGVI